MFECVWDNNPCTCFFVLILEHKVLELVYTGSLSTLVYLQLNLVLLPVQVGTENGLLVQNILQGSAGHI